MKMISDIRELRAKRKINIDMRIGVHSGSIIGGVMGSCKWQYDIWSNDVVIANKMESTGVVGYKRLPWRTLWLQLYLMCFRRKVHVTGQTLELLNGEYEFEKGTLSARNDPFLIKNDIKTFLIAPKVDVDVNVHACRCFKLSLLTSLNLQQAREADEINSTINRTLLTSSVKGEEVNHFYCYYWRLPYNFHDSKMSHTEHNPNRKNFMMNSMEQFRDIMQQTNIEMERELDHMPIGKFQ